MLSLRSESPSRRKKSSKKSKKSKAGEVKAGEGKAAEEPKTKETGTDAAKTEDPTGQEEQGKYIGSTAMLSPHFCTLLFQNLDLLLYFLYTVHLGNNNEC